MLVCRQPNTYDFSLDLIRQVVYSDILPSQRSQLRHKVACAYERLGRPKQDHRPTSYWRQVSITD